MNGWGGGSSGKFSVFSQQDARISGKSECGGGDPRVLREKMCETIT